MRNLRSEKEIMAHWQGDPFKPLASICCTAYNHEPYIEDALEGFLIQETNFPFEILIHDDASTDRTPEIIREYEARYPKLIKPIYQTENQYSKGIKPGLINLKRATSEYIALCEGDDYWTDPAKISIQIEFIKSHHNCVMCFHRSDIWHYKDGKIEITTSRCFSDIELWPKSTLFLEGGSNAPTATILFKRSALDELPDWYYLSPVGDMAMKLLFFLRGDIGFINRVMAVRRLGTPGSWNVRTRLNPLNQNVYLTKMIEMLKNFNESTNNRWKKDVYKKIISYELQKKMIGLFVKMKIKNEYFKKLRFLGFEILFYFQKIKAFMRRKKGKNIQKSHSLQTLRKND